MVDKSKIESRLNSLKLSLSRLTKLKALSKETFLSDFS